MVKHFLTILLFVFSITVYAQENKTLAPIILQGSNNDLNVVAMSPAKLKRMAVAGWDNEVLIYNTDSPYNLVQKLIGHTAQINTLAYTLTGNMFASAGSDMDLRLYDSLYRYTPFVNDNTLRHFAAINAMVFDRTGRFLFSGDKEGRLMLWDVLNKKPIKFYETGNCINDICLSNNSANIFVAQSDKQIKLIALAGGKEIKTMVGHKDVVNVLALSSNNQFLISGSNDKTAIIWDLKTWKPLHTLAVGSWKITAVAFTDDCKYCVTGCNDGAVKVWEVETGKLVSEASYPELNIRDIAFGKNNQFLLVAPKLKGSKEFGARIIPSKIPMPVVAVISPKPLSPAQKSVDSIMAIRPLTKQDSIKFKSVLMVKPVAKPNTGANPTTAKPKPLDSTIIYKTPMNGASKKK